MQPQPFSDSVHPSQPSKSPTAFNTCRIKFFFFFVFAKKSRHVVVNMLHRPMKPGGRGKEGEQIFTEAIRSDSGMSGLEWKRCGII